MSNLSGNGPTNEYGNRRVPSGQRGPWLIPSVAVVILALLLLGYGYSKGWMNMAGEHAASTTSDPATPVATPKP